MALKKIIPATYTGERWEARVQGGVVNLVLRGLTTPIELPAELRPKGTVYAATSDGLLKIDWQGKLEPPTDKGVWQNVLYVTF